MPRLDEWVGVVQAGAGMDARSSPRQCSIWCSVIADRRSCFRTSASRKPAATIRGCVDIWRTPAFRASRFAEAGEAFRKASRLAPRNGQHQSGIANSLAMQGIGRCRNAAQALRLVSAPGIDNGSTSATCFVISTSGTKRSSVMRRRWISTPHPSTRASAWGACCIRNFDLPKPLGALQMDSDRAPCNHLAGHTLQRRCNTAQSAGHRTPGRSSASAIPTCISAQRWGEAPAC